MRFRSLAVVPILALAGGAIWYARAHRTVPVALAPAASAHEEPPRVTDAPMTDSGVREDDDALTFRVPSGDPTGVRCEDARLIVREVREELAYSAPSPTPDALAESASDWLDPHALWSLAPDAPTEPVLRKRSPDIIAELEGRRQGCRGARDVAKVLARWSAELARAFDEGHAKGSPTSLDPARDPLPGTKNARDAAVEIGARAAALEKSVGPGAKPFVDASKKRFFPPLDEDGWERVVLAAAVRAYVPIVDPHGAWAPLDEEASIYEVDLVAHPPTKPWARATSTAIGALIDGDALAPLKDGDVVLSLGGVETAGLALEQVDQLGYAVTDGRASGAIVVYRDGKILTFDAFAPEPSREEAAADDDLPIEHVAWGNGHASIIQIHDVRDDLGDQLSRALGHARHDRPDPLVGVVLDLRGDGGGSTEGAAAAISLFLPGVALFPTRRRDGTVEIERAPEARPGDVWNGPVATFVDGATASAAEMISGAISAYQRGPMVGATTFGKGCAQEYLDDDAHAGVLRLTTLLYALPDGTPVQRVGLAPTIRFPFARTDGEHDREADLEGSPPTWRGLDARTQPRSRKSDANAWPSATAIGPCSEDAECKALTVLAAGGLRAPIAKHR